MSDPKPSILVTGGAGYIGSHTAVELINRGYRPVIVDTLANSSLVALDRVREITRTNELTFIKADVRDTATMERVLKDEGCGAVIHFAGMKAVGESVEKPLEYYSVNVQGTISLVEAMLAAGAPHIVFSSSSTVYGEPQFLPYTEDHPKEPVNPYGRTKLTAERVLMDVAASGKNFAAGILRYFNPIGAHASGLIGEDPLGIPNNLVPFVAQVAIGRRPELNVFGNDYDTPDGTGIRDYIHVVDLAEAHIAALEYLKRKHESFAVNIGAGEPISVMQVVHAFEEASGRKVPVNFAPRRAGDLPAYHAHPGKAKELLGWQTRHSLLEMCRDHWNWTHRNPKGYAP